jgi:hypothetical protein
MKEEKKQVLEISQALSNDLNKAGMSALLNKEGFDDLAQLKKHLTRKISELLDNNYEKLISILYRIDVNENKLNELFGSKNRDFIPDRLADLIIERQIQKINIRNMNRDNKRLSGE